uniref:hypothetical protein n=1 Tax=Escherichia coli TaxID=562 RepID=UPI002A5AE29B|nr:hypothetical protein [Escherichia coli]WPB10545.1 hypothetical protein pHum4b_000001 [Escherichia coli]
MDRLRTTSRLMARTGEQHCDGAIVIILCLSGILVIYQVHDAQSELENVLNTTTVGYIILKLKDQASWNIGIGSVYNVFNYPTFGKYHDGTLVEKALL